MKGLTVTDVEELGDSTAQAFDRLIGIAVHSDNPAVRNAAGTAVARMAASVVKHGGPVNAALTNQVQQIRKANSGFKEEWRKGGRQGRCKPELHHRVLCRFISRLHREIMPPEMIYQVAQDMLGEARGPEIEEVPAKLRTRFRRWAVGGVEGLAEMRRLFAKNRDSFSTRMAMIETVSKHLDKLCARRFDSLWDELFVPVGKRIFASDKNPLLTDKELGRSSEWKNRKGTTRVDWHKHESVMKRRLKEHIDNA